MQNEQGAFTALMLLVGVGSAIFWMVVGWRAMRAHERIARSLDKRTDGGP